MRPLRLKFKVATLETEAEGRTCKCSTNKQLHKSKRFLRVSDAPDECMLDWWRKIARRLTQEALLANTYGGSPLVTMDGAANFFFLQGFLAPATPGSALFLSGLPVWDVTASASCLSANDTVFISRKAFKCSL